MPAGSAVSGRAMFSRLWRSALTPNRISTNPPTAMIAAPMKKPIATVAALPVAISAPNRSGPTIPPAPVPTA
jgi:hypothetical protein